MYSPLVLLITRTSSQLPFPDTFYLDSPSTDYSFLQNLQRDTRISGVLILFDAPPLISASSYFSFPPPPPPPLASPSLTCPPPQSRFRCGWETVTAKVKKQWKRLAVSSGRIHHGDSPETASAPTTPAEQAEFSTAESHGAAWSPGLGERPPTPTVPSVIAQPQNLSFARCRTPAELRTYPDRRRRVSRFSWCGLQ